MNGERRRLEGRLAEVEAEVRDLRAENARLKALLGLGAAPEQEAPRARKPTLLPNDRPVTVAVGGVDRSSPPEAKVALFRSLFAGRDDVYALRWENTRTGQAGWGPADGRNARRPDREHLPFTEAWSNATSPVRSTPP